MNATSRYLEGNREVRFPSISTFDDAVKIIEPINVYLVAERLQREWHRYRHHRCRRYAGDHAGASAFIRVPIPQDST